MGVSAVVAAGAVAGSAAYGAREQRKARKEAEDQARQEREAIEAMQREIQTEVAEPEKAMPAPDDDAARRARRRSVAGLARRRGRASTILTGDTGSADALG